MTSAPALSVIVPVYKTEAYLPACLDSLLAQTLEDIEILVVNDCSPDGSRELIHAYCRRDPRIRLIDHARNLGLGAARNTGLDHARGAFVGGVDSDDFVAANTFELAMQRCIAERTDAALFSAREYIEGEERYRARALYDLGRYPRCLQVTPEHLVTLPPTFQLKLYRRDLIAQLGVRFTPGLFHEDVEFFWKLFGAMLPRLSMLPEPLYSHRKRSDQTSIMDNTRTTRADIPLCLFNAMTFLMEQGRFEPVRGAFVERVIRALYVIGHVRTEYREQTFERTKQLLVNLAVERHEVSSDAVFEELEVIRTGSLWDYLNWRIETEPLRRDAAVERALRKVYESSSWRFTSPLRALARRLGRG